MSKAATKRRSLVLRPHEANALAKHGRVLIVREVKPQPEPPRAIYSLPDADTAITPKLMLACSPYNPEPRTALGWTWEMTRLGSVEARRCDSETYKTVCPFGKPGDLLVGKEKWAWDYDNGWVVYAADEPAGDWSSAWCSGSQMREIYSRFPSLLVESIEVRRSYEVTREEATSLGWQPVNHCDERGCHCYTTWVERLAGKGWCWFAAVKVGGDSR